MRCYNGCPDSDLRALLDAEKDAIKRLKELCPHAHATYFHPTGLDQDWGWQVWDNQILRPISGFHRGSRRCMIEACEEAIRNFNKKSEENNKCSTVVK